MLNSTINLNKRIIEFEQNEASKHPINVLRNEMSQQAFAFGTKSSGIYQLSIPTGGGKTLASLRYALEHAKVHHKERIIYVVPFTTIIEQNAQVVRDIVGDNNLLEHHSNVIDDDFIDKKNHVELNQTKNEKAKENRDTGVSQFDLKLAKDDWDSPVIFTTMVQYLNVFYSKGTRNIRRLHNLADAIIIFDEVQTVPIKCLSLFNESVNFLKNYCQTSLLLCTATQPALDCVKNTLDIARDSDSEIVQNLPEVIQAFKRVEIVDKTKKTTWNAEEISEFTKQLMNQANSVLIVLNTKKAVRTVYQQLIRENDESIHIFHLSTNMCPKHRKDKLNEMIKLIKENQSVICVSSQLIEAGVDISFDHVIRSLAGLDSIAQAAGRCNRHGIEPIREVYIINVDTELEKLDRLPEIERGASITKKLLSSIKLKPKNTDVDLLGPVLMQRYFQEYYKDFKKDADYYVKQIEANLFDLLGENKFFKTAFSSKNGFAYSLFLSSSMKTIGQYFKVIDNQTTAVLVPYISDNNQKVSKEINDEALKIITTLNGNPTLLELTQALKKAQQYSVNLYEQDIKALNRQGMLLPLYQGEGYYLLESAYDTEYGVNLTGDGAMEIKML